jgi:hypothetical protein
VRGAEALKSDEATEAEVGGSQDKSEAGVWHVETDKPRHEQPAEEDSADLASVASNSTGGRPRASTQEESALPVLRTVITDDQQPRTDERAADKRELPAEEDTADPSTTLPAEPSAWTIPLLQPFIDSTVDSAVGSWESTVLGTPPFICARAGCLRGQEHTKICQAMSTIVNRNGWDSTYKDICV